MDELRQLLLEHVETVNWVSFCRSYSEELKHLPVEQRETLLREFKQQIEFGFSFASQVCQVSIDFVRQNYDFYADIDIYYSIDALNVTEFVHRIDSWNRMWPFLKHFDQDIIWRFKEDINWAELLEDKLFKPQFFDEHIDYFIWLNKQDKKLDIWKRLSFYQHLSDQFIQKYEKKLDWELMSSSQPFSEHIMLKYIDKINWDSVLNNKKVIISYNVERELRNEGIM